MEIRTTINRELHGSIIFDGKKLYTESNGYLFDIGQKLTFKRLNKECEVIERHPQQKNLQGSFISHNKYLVKGDDFKVLVEEYELTTKNK